MASASEPKPKPNELERSEACARYVTQQLRSRYAMGPSMEGLPEKVVQCVHRLLQDLHRSQQHNQDTQRQEQDLDAV